MINYRNWKILKTDLDKKQAECTAADCCNNNGYLAELRRKLEAL